MNMVMTLICEGDDKQHSMLMKLRDTIELYKIDDEVIQD